LADTTYRVVLALDTAGDLTIGVNKATAAMNHAHDRSKALEHAWLGTAEAAERAFHRVGSAVEGVADTIMHVAGNAAAVGIGALFSGAVYGVASLNNELEQTQISLGAIFNAQGLSRNFNQGFQMAGEQVAKMKQDVKTLPGDLGQLSAIMKTIAPSSAQGGLNVDQIRQLAGKTMLVGQIVGVDQALAAREMAELLEGRATSRNKLAQRIGLGGERGKELRHESAAQRVKDVEETLSHYDAATSVFARSFIANWTTLKDNIKYGFLADATSPLFDSVKSTIVQINTWFSSNQDEVKMWALAFGSHFRSTWNLITAELHKFGPALENMGRVFFDLWDRGLAKIKELEPVIEKIAKLLEHTTATGIIDAGKGVIGSKLGGMGLNLAGDAIGGGVSAYRMYSMWKLAKKVEALGGAGAAGAAEGAAAEGVGAGTAAVAGAGAGGAAGLLASLGGIPGIAILLGIGASVGTGAGLVYNAGQSNRRDMDHAYFAQKFNMPLKELAESATNAVDPLANVIKNLKTISEFDWYLHLAKTPPAQVHPGTFSDDVRDNQDWQDLMDKDKKRLPGGGGTNIQKVEIIVKGSDDPSRVARMVIEHVNRLGRNPTRSPYAQNWER
jgi:hypothetical protein